MSQSVSRHNSSSSLLLHNIEFSAKAHWQGEGHWFAKLEIIGQCPHWDRKCFLFHICNCFHFLSFPICLSSETIKFFWASQTVQYLISTYSFHSGSYKCTCLNGYSGNGTQCKGQGSWMNLPLFKIVRVSFHFLCYFVGHDGIHSPERKTSLEVKFALKFHGSSKRSGKSSFLIPFSVLFWQTFFPH